MIEEELVQLVAESIFRNLRDAKIIIAIGDFEHLSESEKHLFLSMAHNAIATVNDWYDLECEKEFDDELDDDVDDGYEEHLRLYELDI